RGQRRARHARAHASHRVGRARARRPSRGDQLPLGRRPRGQALRAGAAPAPRRGRPHEEADPARSRRGRAESAQPKRAPAGCAQAACAGAREKPALPQGRGGRMKTLSMVAAICLVGTLLSAGAFWRAERVRAAYRIRGLSDRLAHAKNENAWLKGEIEKRRNPLALEAAAKRRGAAGLVRDLPVVTVAYRDHEELPTP